jgi:CobQ-like glutamine amidotransferase family enzyme
MTRPLRIAHLHPESMAIYGDIGNVRTLLQRAAWRGIDAEVVGIEAGPCDLGGVDLLVMGGGQDVDQDRVFPDVVDHKREQIAGAVAGGMAVLAVCGGYQLLGHEYVDAQGRHLAGLGLLDLRTEAGAGRWIGNVVLEADASMGLSPRTVVGFENHGGRTRLGPSLRPLGRVVVGGGNNGEDGGEGVVAGRVVGTYLHGSILPKNPALADWLLAAALAHRDGGEPAPLAPLDDSLELVAHRRAAELAQERRRRGPDTSVTGADGRGGRLGRLRARLGR